MNKLMLIDGNSIINRAFYALPLLTNKKGAYTNAIYGFMNIFLKFYDMEKPSHVLIAFDVKAPTFRHIKYKEYKGQRKGMPEELKEQVPVLKDLLRLMNIPMVEMAGFEADDILGTYAKLYEKKGFDVTIVSGDRDLLQIATDKINIKIPKTKGGKTEVESYYANDLVEKMGVTPSEFIDVKALMGDTSDNVPGVPGVGEKTALKLICEYKSLENLMDNIDKVSGAKLKLNLAENKELAFESKFLVTIKTDVEVNEDIANDLSFYNQEVDEMLEFLETKALREKLKRDFGEGVEIIKKEKSKNAERNENLENTQISLDDNTKTEEAKDNNSDLSNGIESLKIKGEKYIKNNSLNLISQDVINIKTKEEYINVLKNIGDKFFYKIFKDLKTNEIDAVTFLSDNKIYYVEKTSMLNDVEDINDEDLLGVLKGILEDNKILKITYDIKIDIKEFIKNSINIENYFDIMIAEYSAISEFKEITLENLANDILNLNIESEADLLAMYDKNGKKKAKDFIKVIDVKEDIRAEYLTKLYNFLSISYNMLVEEIVLKGAVKLFYEIENPLVKVLAKMECNGINIDKKALNDFATSLKTRIEEIQTEIYKLAGEEFNISSPKQLASILFDKLMLVSKKKTKTGMSTGIEVLEKLRDAHPIIDLVIEYRQLEKLRGTYADGMVQWIENDGKIHTTFTQIATATGRLSSINPNLQNIPIRMELGKEIRKAFITTDDNHIFLDADYSQIELRIMAHLSGDEKLINAYNSGDDIHKLTASQVFDIPFEEVTKEQRSAAKAVNFGIIYGISAFGLSNDINISRKEANLYIENYFKKYIKVKEYLDKIVLDAINSGYSETMFKRIRKIDEIRSSNHMQKEFGKRIAMNTPVQGTAADIMKLAMVNLDSRLTKENVDAKVLVQVHDELLIEVSKKDADKVKKIVKEELENVTKLSVPLLIEIEEGMNWYEAK